MTLTQPRWLFIPGAPRPGFLLVRWWSVWGLQQPNMASFFAVSFHPVSIALLCYLVAAFPSRASPSWHSSGRAFLSGCFQGCVADAAQPDTWTMEVGGFIFSKHNWFFFLLFVCLQDSFSALAHDLNYPALRKNKNIEAFLNRCESQQLFVQEADWVCMRPTNAVWVFSCVGGKSFVIRLEVLLCSPSGACCRCIPKKTQELCRQILLLELRILLGSYFNAPNFTFKYWH